MKKKAILTIQRVCLAWHTSLKSILNLARGLLIIVCTEVIISGMIFVDEQEQFSRVQYKTLDKSWQTFGESYK